MSAYPPEIAAIRLTLEDLGPPASTLLAGVWRWRAPDSLAIALPGGRPLAEGRRALRGVRELLELWLPGVDVAVVVLDETRAALDPRRPIG